MWGGEVTITREELGEYLIHRFGADKLQYLVNRRVIEIECGKRGVKVTEEEIDADLKAYLATLPSKPDEKVFEREMLARMGKNLLEWREDVIRPRLMLDRLAKGRAQVTEEDLKKCFDAYHGERMECRMILWPRDQERFALQEYNKLRDSEVEFVRAARTQATPSLAAKEGLMPPFGRRSLGDDNVEREAFKLQPGEVSSLIGTPQGHVMLKCVRRHPPDTNVTLEQERARLTAEVLDRKHQIEMQLAFKELYEKAAPRLMIASSGTPVDLAAEARQLLNSR
jgi:hypothetical protein